MLSKKKASGSTQKTLTEIFGVSEQGLQVAFFKNDAFVKQKAIIGDAILDLKVREYALKKNEALVPEKRLTHGHGIYVANDTMRRFMTNFGGKLSGDINTMDTHDIGTAFEYLFCVSSHQDQFLSFYFEWCDQTFHIKTTPHIDASKQNLKSLDLDKVLPDSFVKFFQLTDEQTTILSTDTTLKLEQRAFIGMGVLKLSVLKHLFIKYDKEDVAFLDYFSQKFKDSQTIQLFMKEFLKIKIEAIDLDTLFKYGLGLTTHRDSVMSEYIEWGEKNVIHRFTSGSATKSDYNRKKLKAILMRTDRALHSSTKVDTLEGRVGKLWERKKLSGDKVIGKKLFKKEGKEKGKGKEKETK